MIYPLAFDRIIPDNQSCRVLSVEVPVMPWPQTVDYNSAIQNPSACFADEELARGQPAEGMFPGIPLSYAGNFATVYKMVGASGACWAVKCFTRKVDNLQQRYREISAHLNRRKRRFVVDFQYVSEGIRASGEWYPIVKMQWVEGFTLNEFLRAHVGNPAILEQLCQLWLRLGNDMRDDRMAHGDLQHGNVLLVPGSSATSMLLRLVDYDGMWVPALADLPAGEVGHANYQHPARLQEGGYNDQIDRFAHLVIYTALRCLMVGGKALWDEHDNQENLLFREVDFKAPGKARLFPRLLALPDASSATLAGHLLLASQGPLDQVPLLGDLLVGGAVMPLSGEQIDHIRTLVPSASSTVFFAGVTATLAEVNLATVQETAAELPVFASPHADALMNVTAEQKRMAAQLYAHAQEALEKGNPSYAVELLNSCCKLDPATIDYRKLLRELTWEMSRDVARGWRVSLRNRRLRRQLRAARKERDHRRVLELGEEVLLQLPADVPTQLDMADAAGALGLTALALWMLQQAHERVPATETALCARIEERQNRLLQLHSTQNQAKQGTLPEWDVPTPGTDAGPVSPAPYLWLDCPPDLVIVPEEQSRMADELFARAGEVLYKGDPAYALELLLSCCKLDPARIAHRQKLREVARQVQRLRPGSWLDALTNRPVRARLKAARQGGDHRQVLEHGEALLTRSPDDVSVQLDMAEAAEALGLPRLAVWLLEEAHDRAPTEIRVLHALAPLCERNGWDDAAEVAEQRIQRLNPRIGSPS